MRFTEAHCRALFLLAGIGIEGIWKLQNQYWPSASDFDEYRRVSPWWLVKTPFGMVRVGWRKRVMEIDWSATGYVLPDVISGDSVTKTDTLIHAWSWAKAVEYLTQIAGLLYACYQCGMPEAYFMVGDKHFCGRHCAEDHCL